MMKPAEWEQVRVARTRELWNRLSALPDQYREWVLHSARDQGLPSLTMAAVFDYPTWFRYHLLLGRCEMEPKRRAAREGAERA